MSVQALGGRLPGIIQKRFSRARECAYVRVFRARECICENVQYERCVCESVQYKRCICENVQGKGVHM